MLWHKVEHEMPKIGLWVLVWNSDTKIASMAKWSGKRWSASGGICVAAAKVSHWTKVYGPNGEGNEQAVKPSYLTTRDSQHA